MDPLVEPSSAVHRSEPLPGRTRTLSIAWGPRLASNRKAPVTKKNSGPGKISVHCHWEFGFLFAEMEHANRAHPGQDGCEQVEKGKEEGTCEVHHRLECWGVEVSIIQQLPQKQRADRGDHSDHTVISGDSMGAVTFWDGGSLAQIKSFQSHAADAQCMAIGPVCRG